MADYGGYNPEDYEPIVALSADQRQMAARYLDYELSGGEIEEMLSYDASEVARFWAGFRILYEDYEGNVDAFIESEKSVSGPERYTGTTRDRKRKRTRARMEPVQPGPVDTTTENTLPRSLPEPQIPGSGRGGSNAPGRRRTVIRALRRLRWIIGGF